MPRLSGVFVAVCMVSIAASLGVVLYIHAGLSGAEAAIVSLAAITGLAIYNATANRLYERGEADGRVADLSRGTADLARQVIDLGRRVAAMEAKLDTAIARSADATKPLADEMEEIGALISRLAESVAVHDAALRAGAAAPPQPYADVEPSRRATPQPAPAVARAGASGAGPMPVSEAAETDENVTSPRSGRGRFDGMPPEAASAIVREAIEANRVELLLQPMVVLPQRKVRWYEALARLRARDGELLLPGDFLPVVERDRLVGRLDEIMLMHGMQVVRRLLGKNREVGLFCNVSAGSLVDPQVFPRLMEFADANRALAPSFVFEFRQSAYRTFGPIETESLGSLADLGFRFSLDNVADLRIEPRDLADRGFRYVKVPAALLLARNAALVGDIHPADLAGLLSRFGIDAIAEKIETEATVVDLLDFDLKFGQGHLFSAPRPVRPEVLQSGPASPSAAGATSAGSSGLTGEAFAPPTGSAAARGWTPASAAQLQAGIAPPAPASEPGIRIQEAKPDGKRPSGPASGDTVLAQIARGMLARK